MKEPNFVRKAIKKGIIKRAGEDFALTDEGRKVLQKFREEQAKRKIIFDSAQPKGYYH